MWRARRGARVVMRHCAAVYWLIGKLRFNPKLNWMENVYKRSRLNRPVAEWRNTKKKYIYLFVQSVYSYILLQTHSRPQFAISEVLFNSRVLSGAKLPCSTVTVIYIYIYIYGKSTSALYNAIWSGQQYGQSKPRYACYDSFKRSSMAVFFYYCRRGCCCCCCFLSFCSYFAHFITVPILIYAFCFIHCTESHVVCSSNNHDGNSKENIASRRSMTAASFDIVAAFIGRHVADIRATIVSKAVSLRRIQTTCLEESKKKSIALAPTKYIRVQCTPQILANCAERAI